MEVGASLIGFIGFGLASIKTFHKFVSSIKDGPQKLQDVAKALDSLRAAYERTQALQDLPGILESSPSLIQQLKRCNDDVERFSKALVKLQIQPGEKKHSTLRKKFKLPLCEDEIRDMLGVFSGYVASFTLEISLLDIRIAHLNSSAISQVITGNKQQSKAMQQQQRSLDSINKDAFRFASRIEHVQNVVDALALKVESLPSVSTRQSAVILELFAKLEGKFNDLTLREDSVLSTSRRGDTFGITPAYSRNAEAVDAKVVGSIHRLSELVDEKDRLVESDEAQDIIDDLGTLLQDMDTSIKHLRLGLPGTSSFDGEKEHRRELRQVLGVLNSSPGLTINPGGRSQCDPGPSSGRIGRKQQNLALYQSQLGNWLVSTRKQWRVCDTTEGDEEHQEYVVTIAFRPTARGGSHHIKISIRQLQQVNGFHAFAPAISVGRIVPSYSRVFQCVRLGLFDELLRLIVTGDASLQDRDERGAPLIHYAHSQPEICRFLIKHGADVDELADDGHVMEFDPELNFLAGGEICTPLWNPSLLADVSWSYLDTLRTLLSAGADPTLMVSDKSHSFGLHFALASDAGDKVSFEAVLSLGATFVDANDRDQSGKSLLHNCAVNSKYEHMSALIERGADVNTRDPYGQTCLQFLVTQLRMVGRCFYDDQAALIVLIEAGADVLSRDNNGNSIWETAIQNQQEGSYARDIWDSVMVSYGYHAEVEKFAERVKRHAIYAKWYRRYHFEHLWEGNEHLCPYYDDEAIGLDSASFIYGSNDTDSDSLSSLGRMDEEDSDDAGSASNEESESRQTESDGAAETVEGSVTGTADGMPIETGSTTDSASRNSLSKGSHEVPGSHRSQQLLHSSVTSWLSISDPLEEIPPSDASAQGHEELEPLCLGSNAGHTDEIFHNPWAEM